MQEEYLFHMVSKFLLRIEFGFAMLAQLFGTIPDPSHSSFYKVAQSLLVEALFQTEFHLVACRFLSILYFVSLSLKHFSSFAPPAAAARNWGIRCGGRTVRRSPPPGPRTTGPGRSSHTCRFRGGLQKQEQGAA